MWVLKEQGWTHRAILMVVIGLILGQWWFLEYGAASVLWTIYGFAP